MSRIVIIVTFLSCALVASECAADCLKFSCDGVGEGIIWKYTFEIDKDTSTGVERGMTLDGYPYKKDIEVEFAPEHMHIRASGDEEITGWIDRTDLSFSYGWAHGFCKILSSEKKDIRF